MAQLLSLYYVGMNVALEDCLNAAQIQVAAKGGKYHERTSKSN
jgi:hypothetical protein